MDELVGFQFSNKDDFLVCLLAICILSWLILYILNSFFYQYKEALSI